MNIEFRLEPGDMISFNNRRVMHARRHFDLKGGHRHLQGAYIDWDEFYNRYRVLHLKYKMQ